MPNVRQRNRPAPKKEPTVTKEIKDAVETMYDGNKAKNAGATIERKSKKNLEHLMAQASEGEAWSFHHAFVPRMAKDGAPQTVEVGYGQSLKESADVHELAKHVDMDTLLQIVTASRAEIERVAGKNIANLCMKTVRGDFSAKIKALK